MIVHSSIDEKGQAHGGKAGDQTKKEVCTRSWYNSNWNVCLRHPDKLISRKAASIAKKLADSNLVGYDQYQRNTLYNALVKYGWDVDKYIESGELTECDCSSFMYAVYCCVIPKMRKAGNAPTTRTMRNTFYNAGFKVLVTNDYLKSDNKLITGDVLVHEGYHTVMNITDNVAAEPAVKYYPKYEGKSISIVDGLRAVGESNTSLAYRKKIAVVNNIVDYVGTSKQNGYMLNLLKQGKLVRV